MIAPMTTTDQFILPRFSRLTGKYIGKLHSVSHKEKHRLSTNGTHKSMTMISEDQHTEIMLIAYPNRPRSKFGCGGSTLRPRTRRITIGIVYPSWKQMPPQLTTAWNAKSLPRTMRPRIKSITKIPVKARSGIPNRSLIFENQEENGNAPSRAMLHARRDAAVLVPTMTRYFDSQMT